jgi:hypothetical protein
MRLTLALLLLLSLRAFAAKVPDSPWENGTLTDITDEQHVVTTQSEHSYGSHRHSTTTDNSYSIPHYTIETDKYINEAIANGGSRRRKLAVTINGPLNYALIGNDFYIQDEHGKEHKMTVLKKTLKTPQPTEQK